MTQTMSNPTEGMTHFQKIDHFRRKSPDAYTDEYDELINGGGLPRIAYATVVYLQSKDSSGERLTARKIAKEYDTSVKPIYNYLRKLGIESRLSPN